MSERPRLLFVSARFLFPADQGGKIRSTQILRGMKNRRFEIILASPASNAAIERHRGDLEGVCDRFIHWYEPARGALHKLTRLRHLFSPLPVSIASDRSPKGARVVAEALARDCDLVVFDFLHAVVLAPEHISRPAVIFTHNVEAEIFRRHEAVTRDPVKRWIWREQFRKTQAYETVSLRRFDTVVAVSPRDAEVFAAVPGVGRVEAIPTGVDLDYFCYRPPGDGDHIVFTGAMDWLANIDGIEFFLDQVWGRVAQRRPGARATIVGRNPAPNLVERTRRHGLPFHFTGFVDDIRPHIGDAAAYIIPLRVGGGTRIKAYEAMAMGIPVVSTALGVEGLPVRHGEHYLNADTAEDFADALVRLLEDRALARRLSEQARRYVEEHFSSKAVAQHFEDICWTTLHPGEHASPPRFPAQPATSNQQPATSNQQPATSNQQPATSNQRRRIARVWLWS